jgi:hypothetical protein
MVNLMPDKNDEKPDPDNERDPDLYSFFQQALQVRMTVTACSSALWT